MLNRNHNQGLKTDQILCGSCRGLAPSFPQGVPAGARRGGPGRAIRTDKNGFQSSQRGATAIYIALLVALLMLSAALVLTSVLTRQVRLTQNVVSSERAFYAANSGVEEALYQLVQQTLAGEQGNVSIADGEIEYEDATATYSVEARTNIEGPSAQACISSLGEYQGDQRRISLGPAEQCL